MSGDFEKQILQPYLDHDEKNVTHIQRADKKHVTRRREYHTQPRSQGLSSYRFLVRSRGR